MKMCENNIKRQFHFILTIGLTNLKKDNVCIKRYKGNEN
jgi:hypothetical protein